MIKVQTIIQPSDEISAVTLRFLRKKKTSIKQIDANWPYVCILITHRGRQNVVRTSVALLTTLVTCASVLW